MVKNHGFSARCMFFLASIMCLSVRAEGGCPPGYYPHNAPGLRGCAPIPGYYSPPSQEIPSPIREPPKPKRWGSIAVDTAKQVAGFSKGNETYRQAEKAAIKDCKSKGGKGCYVEVTYSNACIGMAVGEKAKFGTARGETEGQALFFAMKFCELHGGVKCQVYYAGCSFVDRVN